MKEFEKWMNIGLHNVIAENYIPMGFQPTLPLLLKRGSQQCIAFYYYHMMVDGSIITISSPKYRLVLNMKTEKPVLFEELEHGNKPLKSCVAFPGSMDSFELKQKAYIAKINASIEKNASVEADDFFEDWIQAHLHPLQESLRNIKEQYY